MVSVLVACCFGGQGCGDLGRVGFAIDVDHIQFTATLFHVVGKVVNRAHDDQMAGFYFIRKLLLGCGDLVVHVGFYTFDISGNLSDGLKLFLDRRFQFGLVGITCCCRRNSTALGVADDQQQR